eukprot:1648801-Rhodomonas_salina.2
MSDVYAGRCRASSSFINSAEGVFRDHCVGLHQNPLLANTAAGQSNLMIVLPLTLLLFRANCSVINAAADQGANCSVINAAADQRATLLLVRANCSVIDSAAVQLTMLCCWSASDLFLHLNC